MISIIDKESGISELEERFLTGIHWYNKGRWKYDATEAFLYYWIGIEALFGGISQQPLFDQMSRLEVTWRRAYGYGMFGLKSYWFDLVRMLSESKSLVKRLDNTPGLKDWNVNRRILADHENVKKVIALIPAGKKKVKDYAKQYLDFLISFVNNRTHYESKVELLRSEFRFKLLILKDLRNSITHSGRHEHPALLLYSNELQTIFEDLLFVVGNAVIQPDPRSAAMTALIDEVNEWWVK